mmetsp:Transcript_33942/g.87145  ORF Transcript_33942/g.87145 Transcript_33942/m.87145 type:complete len:92 (+) Transcript_33942:81-356(+)
MARGRLMCAAMWETCICYVLISTCLGQTMEVMRAGKQISTDRLMEVCLDVYEGLENEGKGFKICHSCHLCAYFRSSCASHSRPLRLASSST